MLLVLRLVYLKKSIQNDTGGIRSLVSNFTHPVTVTGPSYLFRWSIDNFCAPYARAVTEDGYRFSLD